MALPKLNVPVYETILPSTEKVIKYRPFLVKEEKILLTALEAGTENELPAAIKQIINNCIQTKLDVDNAIEYPKNRFLDACKKLEMVKVEG